MEETRTYTSAAGGGRLDVNGVEWFCCDPWPTWYRRGPNERVILRSTEDPAPWQDE